MTGSMKELQDITVQYAQTQRGSCPSSSLRRLWTRLPLSRIGFGQLPFGHSKRRLEFGPVGAAVHAWMRSSWWLHTE